MIDSQYIFPATLSALTILATVLNFTAQRKYLVGKF